MHMMRGGAGHRFDLLHIMIDEPDDMMDRQVAEHIVAVHQRKNRAFSVPYTMRQMQCFIRYCRAHRPQISEQVRIPNVADTGHQRANTLMRNDGNVPQKGPAGHLFIVFHNVTAPCAVTVAATDLIRFTRPPPPQCVVWQMVPHVDGGPYQNLKATATLFSAHRLHERLAPTSPRTGGRRGGEGVMLMDGRRRQRGQAKPYGPVRVLLLLGTPLPPPPSIPCSFSFRAPPSLSSSPCAVHACQRTWVLHVVGRRGTCGGWRNVGILRRPR